MAEGQRSHIDQLELVLANLPSPVVSSVLMDGDLATDQLRKVEASALSDRTVESRRESFRLGRAAAREALDGLGMGRPSITVGPDREPIWPDGVVGSITHAGPYAIATVALARHVGGIGVDLELRRPFEGLRERVAFGPELSWLENLSPSEADAATIEVFSAKEAIFKAFFPRVGRFFGFDAATVQPAGSRDHYIGRLRDGLAESYPSERVFRIDIGWVDEFVLASLILEPD